MNNAKIARLEHADRAAMVYRADVFETETSVGDYLRAISPVIGIVAVAVALVLILV